MSENLRERPDEKRLGDTVSATDAYPYMRFDASVLILKFIVIEDMPVIVTLRLENKESNLARMQWYGFYKGQWYTDFTMTYDQPEMLAKDMALMLEQAEELLLNDLHEPVAAPVEPKVYKNAVCRGAWALGTACGSCERCIDTKPTV